MKNTYLKFISISLFASCFLTQFSFASEEKLPEAFRGDSPSSSYVIDYKDIDAILRASVLVTGPSDRTSAKRSVAATGTRLKSTSKRKTENEGNRFLFESFKEEEYKNILTEIRQSLEKVPSEIQLKYLSKSEQLAYWLNLYNITLLNELVYIYPEKKLEDYFEGRDSLFEKKLLNVAGENLSLNDIQHNILMPKFDNDLRIIYGLYQGIIGGPNIRRTAFTSDNVYRGLKENAYEFINSNRGTAPGKKNKVSISSLYRRNERYFPDFKRDVKNHLLEFLQDSNLSYQLQEAKSVRANIDDWRINDVYGTTRSYGAGLGNSSAALIDSVTGPAGIPGLGAAGKGLGAANLGLASEYMVRSTKSYGRFSPEQAVKIRALDDKRLVDPGEVTVTDLENDEKEKQQNEEK